MSKSRILLVRAGHHNGVSYHRLLVPFKALERLYPDHYDIKDCDGIEQITDEELEAFDFVVCNRNLAVGSVEDNIAQIKRVKAKSKLVIDVDDYWYLHPKHELKGWWNAHHTTSRIEVNVMSADYITTTHPLLGSKANKPYFVWPNGIDTTVDQFKPKAKVLRPTVEFGWVGTSNHYNDIALMKESLKRLNRERTDHRIVFAGYSAKMPHTRKYEEVLTGGFTHNYTQYVNIEGLPIDEYMNLYDHIDVAMIPLEDNDFNNCKSNLKMLEAAFKKKAVIVSNVHPYTSLIDHERNCLKVNTTDRMGWYKSIVRLLNNRELIKELGEQLYKDAQVYEITPITHRRHTDIQSWISKAQ